MKPLQVLLAEDNPGDVFLVREALREHQLEYKLKVITDAAEAERYLEMVGHALDAPCPDIFLLDLNLPKGDGHEILTSFRAHPLCSNVPVVVVTSSDAPADRTRAQLSGATEYFRKPSDLTEFLRLGAVVSRLVNGNVNGNGGSH